MKYYYSLFFLLLSAGCSQPVKVKKAKAYDYCYSSDKEGAFLFSLADKQETRLHLDGTDLCLSPEGTRLAYTGYAGTDHERRIALMNLEDKKTTILDSNCHNCYGPVWSPDGEHIAYNAFNGDAWSIKCVDKDNLHPVMIAKAVNTQGGFYAPSWSTDSKKIVVQDMSAVYIIDLNGSIIKTIPMQEIDTTHMISSNSLFLFNKNEDKVIFQADVDGDVTGLGPPSAIFVYDFNDKKKTRLSPEGYDCFQPVIKADTLFFSGTKGKSKKYNIYSTDLNGGHFKLAFKNRIGLSCRLTP